jgi:hypothetical protein
MNNMGHREVKDSECIISILNQNLSARAELSTAVATEAVEIRA